MSENVWQGDKIRLRAVEPADWQTFFRWNQDTSFERFTALLEFPGSAEAVRRWAAEQAIARPESDDFRWVIETLGGEMAGTLNTHSCDRRNGTFQYGVAVDREHRRRGYAQEAILLVLAHYFWERRYQKVNVQVYDFNVESLQLHQRLGFQQEGCLRRMLYSDGRYHDVFWLGLTRKEFEERAGVQR